MFELIIAYNAAIIAAVQHYWTMPLFSAPPATVGHVVITAAVGASVGFWWLAERVKLRKGR
jgi:hypothetical protein